MFVNKKLSLENREEEFTPITPTNNEPEFRVKEPILFSFLSFSISSVGTDYSQVSAGKLPRGAALITGSGNLAKKKKPVSLVESFAEQNLSEIKKIIHAASGSHSLNYHPTKESIIRSVQNSIILAERLNIKSLAIPLVGGKIFLGYVKKTSPNITEEKLAEAIVKAALNQRKTDLKIIFNDYNLNNFRNVLDRLKNDSNWNSKFNEDNTNVVDGDIATFSTHKCEAIVNAANCEVQFGGGISGIIGSKTGKSEEIDDEARKIIDGYNRRIENKEESRKSLSLPKKQKNWEGDNNIDSSPPVPKNEIFQPRTDQAREDNVLDTGHKPNNSLSKSLLIGATIFLAAACLAAITYRTIKKNQFKKTGIA